MLSLSQALKRWDREPVIGTTEGEIETMRFYSRQAQKITMEINTQYHEPEELRQLFHGSSAILSMIPLPFFRRFIRILARISILASMSSSIAAASSRTMAAFSSVIMSSSAIMSSWLRLIIILTRINGVSSCPAGSSWKKAPGSGPMRP